MPGWEPQSGCPVGCLIKEPGHSPPVGAWLLTVSGGYVFGWKIGCFLTVIAATIGIIVAIFAALFGLIWFPVKRLLKNKREKRSTAK